MLGQFWMSPPQHSYFCNPNLSQDASGMNKLMASLFPEHKGNYYDWDYDVTGDVLDTKWCNIHNVDEGSLISLMC